MLPLIIEFNDHVATITRLKIEEHQLVTKLKDSSATGVDREVVDRLTEIYEVLNREYDIVADLQQRINQ